VLTRQPVLTRCRRRTLYATPANLFAADKKLTEALGFPNSDQFFTDASNMPQKQPQQDPAVVKAQLDAQSRKDQLQFEREKAQLLADIERDTSDRKAQAQKEVDLNRQQLEAQQQEQEQEQRIFLEAEQAERDAQRRHVEQKWFTTTCTKRTSCRARSPM